MATLCDEFRRFPPETFAPVPSIPADLVSERGPSPDGRHIVFATYTPQRDAKIDRGIYIMDSDGTHLHRLTNLQAEDPAFSPDGRRIAFVSIEASQPLIYIVNADGSNIINTAQVGYAPAWRPDGRRIAFNCGAAPPQICAMDDDGANLRRLTGDHFPDYAPQYSPDGRTIVFFSGRVCAPSCAEIYAMSANGSNIHRIGASLRIPMNSSSDSGVIRPAITI